MKSTWDEIEEEIKGFDTEYYDADENADVLERYNIERLPVYIFLDKNGNEIERLNGVQNKDDIVELVNKTLEK